MTQDDYDPPRDPGSQHVLNLARALHELGDVLFFQDDAALSEVVILKPQWVTEHLAKVLDSKQVATQSGVLHRDQLSQLWPDLSSSLRHHFLRLMDKFDMCYQAVDAPEIFYVVERLPKTVPICHLSGTALVRLKIDQRFVYATN